jgi:1-deoxy-D-xylulose-5-phosphate reductoisomerase
VRVVSGEAGLIEAAAFGGAACVITAVSGSVGLKPTLAAIDEGKRIGLANKETLVCAGSIVMRRAFERGAEIVPVDSEHSAIFQSLGGVLRDPELRRILLTAGRTLPRDDARGNLPRRRRRPCATRTGRWAQRSRWTAPP